ncbi:hypothetical protein C6990_00755 [Nitrosopumilus sp. b3]|uniref:DUF192 domain-containing protein n=1 Tax=Nitrosopumilus sp. b3 TaxID=2109909 RepID=UPI0015F611E7|nr:DUF192 domain-containing protein [Nitrosopumilus sp. b3]KAF6248007.1 hypothetical protein C6990_00755 [Nitrosopumilus sp. b3]
MIYQKLNLSRGKFFLLIIITVGIVFGSLKIGIMSDCSSQDKKIRILSCTEIINSPSYIQDKAILSIQSKNSMILVEAEIADELQEQIKGLMFRQDLDWGNGMLFVYESEKKRSFWMENTLIPLDMLFIDTDFRIIDIKENVQPCKTETCPSYPSKLPSKYVLEVNAGFVMMNNIEIGDSVMWNSEK